MSGADIGDERKVRLDKLGGARDVQKVACALLDHRILMLGGELKQGQRHAHIVVVIAVGV